MAISSLTSSNSNVNVRKLLAVTGILVGGDTLILLRRQFHLRFTEHVNTLKLVRNSENPNFSIEFVDDNWWTFFSRSFLFALLEFVFSTVGSETHPPSSVSGSSSFTCGKFGEFVEFSPAKTENLAARSTNAALEGKVKLPVLQVSG